MAEVVGLLTRYHQDWYDEEDKEIHELLEKKRSCHNHLLAKPDDQAAKAAYKTACSTLQAKLRTMQTDLWTGLAERTRWYADMGDMHTFYEALKAIYGPSHQIQAPLRSSNGSTLLKDKEAILQRWSEHFEGLFSDQRTVQVSSLAKIPQVDVKLKLNDLPTREEIGKATMQLKVDKSPGIDGIPAEVYQNGSETVLDNLLDLSTNCWEKGTQDLRDAVTVSLYKNKGEKSDCSNYRGITLLSIAGKILACALLNRLIPMLAQEDMPDSQCRFRSNGGMTDMIFMLGQIQEKCREQNMGLYAAFVDLTKAFDTVSGDGLWKILAHLSCPPNFSPSPTSCMKVSKVR